MSDQAALRDWHLNWHEDEFEWRPDQSWARRGQWLEERELARRARRRRDRGFFGDELWGTPLFKALHTPAALARFGLPAFENEAALAIWLGIPLTRLRWYTFSRLGSPVWHYVRYVIPKRSGGERVILAPKRELKGLQRKVLHEVLEKLPLSEPSHGFRKTRSIVTNATPHTGKKYVLNLDLKDFFPSITLRRVRGLFVSLGYSFAVGTALALLCTESDRAVMQRPDRRYYVSLNPRHIIQGAPTSPYLANLIARDLDRRLNGLARKHQVNYTRYADDLTFSGDDLDAVLRILSVAKHIIKEEGFVINPKKTRLFRRSGRQSVTGLVVNEKVNTPREMRRLVRAILHNAQKNGLNSQNQAKRPDFRAYIQGLIGHIGQSDPARAAVLLRQLAAIPD